VLAHKLKKKCSATWRHVGASLAEPAFVFLKNRIGGPMGLFFASAMRSGDSQRPSCFCVNLSVLDLDLGEFAGQVSEQSWDYRRPR